MDKNVKIPFEHYATANCETGVMHNLMQYNGFQISENLLFGIGSGLYFIYFPYIQMGTEGPLTSYRYAPGSILKNGAKKLGLNFTIKTYKNVRLAMEALDEKLYEGVPVGITGDLYEFEVFPEFVNFHFNNHNLVVYGKEGDEYLISDPIVEAPIRMHKDVLERARYVKGDKDNPKGKMYWLEHSGAVNELPIESAVEQGLKLTCRRMLNPLFPFGGVKGIIRLSKRLKTYPNKKSPTYVNTHLTNMIRHQEIVGSGGSGYRKQFARFLSEASIVLNNQHLAEISEEIQVELAPAWRDYSISMARCARTKLDQAQDKFNALAEELYTIGLKEAAIFNNIRKVIK